MFARMGAAFSRLGLVVTGHGISGGGGGGSYVPTYYILGF